MSSIQRFLIQNMLYVAAASTLLLSLVWILNEYNSFQKETRMIREQFITRQKLSLKKEVNQVIDYVNYMRGQTTKRLRSQIKERTVEACAVAQNLYDNYKGKKSLAEIQEIVKEALRPIRFNEGRGYYFAFSMDGIEQLFADHPEMEGKNMLNVRGAKGEYVVKEMIDILKTQDQGFYQYTWFKPEAAGKDYLKITFIKYFEPFGWGIGTGEYIEDVKARIQDEILNRLINIRFGDEGYFFGSVYGGSPLFTNGEITRGSGSIWKLKDPTGIFLIQEQNRQARKKDGGFIHYQWRKLGSQTLSPKLSYVNDIPEWEWIIGAGVYLDTVETAIKNKRESLFKGFIEDALTSFSILLILAVTIYFAVLSKTRKIRNGIDRFSTFFEKASIEPTLIDPDSFQFTEFRQIAESANHMVEKRLEAIKALQLSEKRYAAITNSAGDSIFCKNEKRQYTFVNKTMADLFKTVPEELIGKTPEQLFDAENAEIIRQVDDRTFNGEKVNEIRTLNLGGKEMTFHTIQVPLEIIDDKVVSISGIVRDITEQKNAEEARRTAEQRTIEQEKHALVGQIAGKISHDFNNILGVIMGNSELALLQCKDENVARTLNLILGQTHRGRNLTRNLTAFAKDQEPKQEFFLMDEKLDLVITLLKKEIENIELTRNYQAGLPEVLADPGMIEHALVNLIQNAVHALSTTASPRLKIRVYTADDLVWCDIEDNGCGIPKEHLNDIFAPSFTLKGSRDTKGVYEKSIKGTGYGLANVKKYMEQHKGKIKVVSEPGKGSTFSVGLPIAKKELTLLEISSYEKISMVSGKYILIVEDETAIADVQYRLLTGKPCCHTVDVAHNGKTALDLISRNAYDCISLDYILPGTINGMDIYNAVRQKSTTLPVLFISGNIEFLQSIKTLKNEDAFLEHVSKPVENTVYIDHINMLLQRCADI